MNKKIYFLALPFIIIMFLSSCSKNNLKLENDMEQDALSIRKKIWLLGFDTSKIVINKETIVVEGDIILNKSALNKAKPRQASIIDISNGGIYPIDYFRHRNLKYYISPVLVSSWGSAIESAFTKYLALSDFNLRFTRTTDSNNADLFIEAGSSAVADSYFPSNGAIGSRIGINTSYSNLSEVQKVFVLVHEIGHTIGLRHTNWRLDESESGVRHGVTVGAYTIPGTSNSSINPDPNSVFNSGTGVQTVPSWSSFSSFDISALITLYPSFGSAILTTNPSGSFPVYVGDQIEAFVSVPNWRESGLTYEWFVQGATIITNNGTSIKATVTDGNSAGIYCKITNLHNESITVSKSFGSVAID